MMQEIHQKLLEQALKSGRALQSKDMRFVHAYYGKSDQTVHQTIPVYENFLFALALARTRTVEGVQEAKALLEKLLAYQSEEGLFPVYLHEYPYNHDLYIGAHLLPVLFWLDHHFHSVIGLDLKKPIQKLMAATSPEVEKMPASLAAKAIGALTALGKVPSLPFPKLATCEGPKEKADWIMGALLAKLPVPPLEDWDPILQLYTGEWRGIRFEKGAPETTLYDFYGCSVLGELPRRIAPNHPALLQAALIFPVEGALSLSSTSEPFVSRSFSSNEQGYLAGSYPYFLAWGKEPHTLVLHPGSLKDVNLSCNTLSISLGEKPPLEDRDGCKEVVFSLQDLAPVKFLVNGAPSTTFRPGDQVAIHMGNAKIDLNFRVIGRGVFQGHFSRGTKPTEWINSGTFRFNGYDWLISLRTIDRDEETKIELDLTPSLSLQ